MESSSPLPRRAPEENNNSVQPTTQQTATPAAPVKQTCGLALASLICGGMSLFFGFFTALPAVICGHMALGDLRRNPDKYESSARGMAIAGLIIGYIFLVITVVFVLFFVFAIAASS